MKKNKILVVLFIGIVCITLGSCNKSAPAGPAGIQGDTGQAGPRGAQGIQGEQGARGTQGKVNNVLYSDWVTPAWTYPTHDTFAYGYIVDSTVTQTIIDQGVVAIYFKDMNTGGSVYKLDYVTDDTTVTRRLAEYKLHLYVSYNPIGLLFRYIIIPPGTSINTRLSAQVPDYNDYQAVCRYYGIDE